MLVESMVGLIWGVLIVGWTKMLRDLVLTGKVKEFVSNCLHMPFKEKTNLDKIVVAYFVLTIPFWLPIALWTIWLGDIIPRR